MGEYWFAAGLLLSIFGPGVFLLPAWLLYRLFRRRGLAARLGVARPSSQQAAHVLLAAALVFALVFASWLPGRLDMARLCDQLAEPRIHERLKVDGFYLDDSTANSFGTRYLYDEGFAWFEARDIYHREAYVRYRRDGARIVTDPVPALSAVHVVRSGVEVRPGGIHVARTEIAERVSGRRLAEAHSITYHGGPLGLFLGIAGMAQCPNPAGIEGSRQFNRYYHLVREVLGGGAAPPGALKFSPAAP